MEDNPQFEQKPATISEFLGPHYLNLDKVELDERGRPKSYVRRRVRLELIRIFGRKVNPYRVARVSEAVLTGCIGWGKSWTTSISSLYAVHWLGCLKDPQGFLGLAPGSQIAAMIMSTKKEQAEDVIFSEVKERLDRSPWFAAFFPANEQKDTKRLTKRLVFPKHIFLIPGDSSENTFEGYNIFFGVLDEGDSHKVTRKKNYADVGYNTIKVRMTSRFKTMGVNRGLLMVVGQSKISGGFMERKYNEAKDKLDAYAVRMAIWEALDKENFCGDYFYFDPDRLMVLERKQPGCLTIPVEYYPDFTETPQNALKDLAGRPTLPGTPWIVDPSKLSAMFNRWYMSHPGEELPVNEKGIIRDSFRANHRLPCVCHIDLGKTRDACGFAMGHISGVRPDHDGGEDRFYVAIDFMMRIAALPGSEIDIAGVRHLVYLLKDRGFNIVRVTLDGFGSTEFIQQVNQKGILCELLSVDKTLAPYDDLHETVVHDLIECPPLFIETRIDGETHIINIIEKEARQLQYVDSGNLAMKVDHPADGSKDTCDPIAGVVHSLLTTPSAQFSTIKFDLGIGPERTLSLLRRRYAG